MDSDNSESGHKGSSTEGICPQCHLPKRVAREGSITSWLFAPLPYSHCTCGSSAISGKSTSAASAAPHPEVGLVPETLADQSSGETLSLPELSQAMGRDLHLLEKTWRRFPGSAYLARENATGEEVVIKLITTKQLFDNPGDIENVDRQAAAVSELSHPNLVSIRDHQDSARGRPLHNNGPCSWRRSWQSHRTARRAERGGGSGDLIQAAALLPTHTKRASSIEI